MNSKIRIFGIIILFALINIAYGQTDKEKALLKGQEAIKLMDNGKIKESIKLLKEAEKLDPDRFDYPYEMAYAHYIDQDYKGAIKILEKNKNHKNVTERLFQLLGNSYDVIGKTEKAFEAYDEGLEKFPNSGIIHLEKGNVYWNKEKYNEALPFYEKGIELDPAFPSNYYRASLLYCSSSESIWGLIYGEIFMNLERNSKRTSEISKLLYDTYKSKIEINGDSAKIDFCNVVIDANDIVDKNNIKLPFCMVFGQEFIMSLINIKSININSLDTIRENFVKLYFENNRNDDYPNILFDYQKKVKDVGHFEAYNHWILMKGDEECFGKWYSDNEKKWETFIEWFTNNGLKLNNEHRFYSGQY